MALNALLRRDRWVEPAADLPSRQQRVGVQDVQGCDINQQGRGLRRRCGQLVWQRDGPVVGGKGVIYDPRQNPDIAVGVAGGEVAQARSVLLEARLERAGVPAGGMGHEEPPGDDFPQPAQRNVVVDAAEQPHRT